MAGRARRTLSRRRPAADPKDEEAARTLAIGCLARRDLPSAAIEERLTAAGFSEAVSRKVLAGLSAERLIDDERYVDNAIDHRRARGQGPLRIAYELKRDGVAAPLIERALKAAAGAWSEDARTARERRFGPGVVSEPRERARQLRFLSQRGFTLDQARRAVGGRGEESEAEDAGLAEGNADHVDLGDAP